MDVQKKKLWIGFAIVLADTLQAKAQHAKQDSIEPSIGLTHWPVKTNIPESFRLEENKWPNYFPF